MQDGPTEQDAPSEARTQALLGRAKLGVALLAARTVLLQLVVLGGNIYLTRVLSPADFGIFAIVQFVMQFFDLLGDAGLGAALIAQKTTPDRRKMSSVFWLQVVLAFGLITLVWATSALILRQWPSMPNDAAWLLRALSLVLLLTVVRIPCSIQMERRLQFGRQATIDVAGRLVYFAVAVPMATSGYGVKALLAAVLGQAATTTLLAHVASPFRPAWVLDRAVLAPIVRFGLAVQARSVLGYVNGALTPIFAGAILGKHAVGLNNWAQGFAYFPLELVQIVSRVSFPVYSQIQDDRPAFERAVARSILLISLAACSFTSLVWGLGPSLVAVVYTAKWLPAMNSLYIYSGAMTIGCLTPLVASALDAIGKPGIISRLSVGWVSLNWAIVVPVMLWKPGLTTFAAAYCVHVVVGNIVVLVMLHREFPGTKAYRALFGPAIGLLVATAVGWALRPLVTGPLSLIATILTILPVFVAASMLHRYTRQVVLPILRTVGEKASNLAMRKGSGLAQRGPPAE